MLLFHPFYPDSSSWVVIGLYCYRECPTLSSDSLCFLPFWGWGIMRGRFWVMFSRGVKMPIYEYQCQSCGHQMEALQKISDPLLTDCPACGQTALKKKVSATAFRLKGGGWYETDFKTGNRKNVSGDKSAGDATGGKAAAGADSKAGGKEKTGASKSGSGTGQGKTSQSGNPAA